MFSQLFLTKNIILNSIIVVISTFMIFYPLGRIIQNRFNLTKRSLALSIPIGLVVFLLINFFFFLPFNFFVLNDQFLNMINMIKDIFIITIILIYFQEWLPPRIQINFERLRLSTFFALINFALFISVVVIMNFYLEDFNQINPIIPSDLPFFSVDKVSYSSSLFNTLVIKNLLEPNLLSITALYKWIYFLIIEIIFYLIAQSYTKQTFKNNYLVSFLGMLLALAFSNYFWISSAQQTSIYIVLLLIIAIFFIKFYFSTWSPNPNIIVFSYWTLFAIFGFSATGILFLFIFWTSSVLFINNYKADSAKLFVHGGYLLSIGIVTISFQNTFLVFILTLFILCIVFIPFTTNYLNSTRSPSIETQTKSDRFVFTSVLLFVFSIVAFLFLLSTTDLETTKNYLLGFIVLIPELAWYWNLLIMALVYFLPCTILLIFFFRNLDKSLTWYYIFAFIFALFMNPLNYYFLYYLFGVQLTIFFWVWPLIIFEIILVNYESVFTFIKRRFHFKKKKTISKVNDDKENKRPN